ncbi:hypothetical protein ARALYDRAFT_917341 [Arabidopsis lyrata subsp. lyrata]|uniref:Uncharacterized protein n=1 Tax=Arabidopsis lyrata subsp. lyrata TaxID=81972 RepID=D7MP98_ARALL|nr:hypothetical protein ARALYDRAFT_917341 [Arabidopsis lyrata subsp. lyrata]
MHSSNLLLEEPIMMASILKPFKSIVGTLGPKYRSVEALSGCLKTGMSGTNHRPNFFVCFPVC